MAIAGTTVAIDQVPGGAALVFRTDRGDVVGLRQRVRYLGDLYELPDAQRQWLRVRGGRDPDEETTPSDRLPDAVTETIPVEGGARLEIRAADAADVESLRALVQVHRDQLEAGHCWTWQPRVPRRPTPGARALSAPRPTRGAADGPRPCPSRAARRPARPRARPARRRCRAGPKPPSGPRRRPR